jgi:predicted PurR-regulated permease PerM
MSNTKLPNLWYTKNIMEIDKTSLHFLQALLIIALLAVCVVFAPYFSVFVLCLVFGVIFRPLHRVIRSYIKNPGLSSLLSTVVVLIIVLGPVALVITQLFREAQGLIQDIQNNSYDVHAIIPSAQAQLQHYFPYLNVDLQSYLGAVLNWVVRNSGAVFSGAANVLVNLLLSAIALYYWFKDGEKLEAALVRLSPLPDKQDGAIISKLSAAIRSIIRGTLLVALVQGTLAGIGFKIFGVPNAVLLGTVTCLCALIPGVGTSLVLAPTIIYLFIKGPLPPAIGLLIWGAVAVGLIDNFIGPKLMSRGSRLHPFFILVSVLGGIKLLGPIGFLAGPLAVSLLFALLDIYSSLTKNGQTPKPA